MRGKDKDFLVITWVANGLDHSVGIHIVKRKEGERLKFGENLI